VIAVGGQRAFYVWIDDAGTWDVMVEDCDGNALHTWYGLDIRNDVDLEIAATGVTGAALHLINGSDVAVCYLYLGPSTDLEWGEDWLGDETIPAGWELTSDLEPGSWDVMAEDCDGNTLDTWYEVNIRGAVTLQIGGPGVAGASLTLINGTDSEICYLYMGPSTEPEWGEDWLGDETIPAGWEITFDLKPGTWDVMVEDCDGNALDSWYDVEIDGAVALEAGWPGGADASLTLINGTDSEICYLYMGPSTEPEWGEDWLGDETIPAGWEITFDLEPGTWDVTVEDCDGNPMDTWYEVAIYGDVTLEIMD
jgi:hypothetical protein